MIHRDLEMIHMYLGENDINEEFVHLDLEKNYMNQENIYIF